LRLGGTPPGGERFPNSVCGLGGTVIAVTHNDRILWLTLDNTFWSI
jgi:hypothetical protein